MENWKELFFSWIYFKLLCKLINVYVYLFYQINSGDRKINVADIVFSYFFLIELNERKNKSRVIFIRNRP